MEEFYKLCQEHLIEGEIIKDKNTVEIKLKKKFGNKNTISLYISRESIKEYHWNSKCGKSYFLSSR